MNSLLDIVDKSSVEINKQELAECRERLQAMGNSKLTVPEKQEKARLEGRVKVLQRGGPRIHIQGLLGYRHRESGVSSSRGYPVWTIVNPYKRIRQSNGGAALGSLKERAEISVANNGWFFPGVSTVNSALQDSDSDDWKKFWAVPVGGFPTLPTRVRELLWSREVRSAYCTGILYQPETWNEKKVAKPSPDPALVVRWDAEDHWHCLAVWGHDGPRIEEFMD